MESSSNDRQSKEWIVGRIESLLNDIAPELESIEELLSDRINKVIQDYQSSRNISLSILGFFASIVLGLSAIGQLSSPTNVWILVIDIVVGGIIFLGINYVIKLLRVSLNHTSRSLLKARTHLNRLRSRVIDSTVDIDSFTYEMIRTYYDYNKLCTIVCMIIFLDGINHARKSSKNWKVIKMQLDQAEQQIIPVIKKYKAIFNEEKQTLEKFGYLKEPHLELLQPLIDFKL